MKNEIQNRGYYREFSISLLLRCQEINALKVHMGEFVIGNDGEVSSILTEGSSSLIVDVLVDDLISKIEWVGA